MDAGWIRPPIAKHLVKYQRNPVEVDDIIETKEQFNARCIVGIDFPTSWKPSESCHMQTRSLCNNETSWHVWYDSDMWTLSGFELRDLGAGRSRSAHMSLRNRQCAILNLRCHDGTQMRVMVMKNLKGTAAAVDTLQFDIVKRQEIMEWGAAIMVRSFMVRSGALLSRSCSKMHSSMVRVHTTFVAKHWLGASVCPHCQTRPGGVVLKSVQLLQRQIALGQ